MKKVRDECASCVHDHVLIDLLRSSLSATGVDSESLGGGSVLDSRDALDSLSNIKMEVCVVASIEWIKALTSTIMKMLTEKAFPDGNRHSLLVEAGES